MPNSYYKEITELNEAICVLKDNLDKYMDHLFLSSSQTVADAYKIYLIDTFKKSPEQVIADSCNDLKGLINSIEIYNNLTNYIKATKSYDSSVEAICYLIKELTGAILVPLEMFESNRTEVNDASVKLAKSGITTNWLVSHGLATEQETARIQQSKNITGIVYKNVKGGIRIDSVKLCGGIIIPEFIDGLPVIKISERAFYKKKNITSVILPRYLKDIGEEAFSESGIVSISIPNSVERIGAKAFYNCRNAENIILPEGLKSIKYHTFGGCSALTRIRIPTNVVAIGDCAFGRCKNLEMVQIPDSVVRFGYSVFDSKPTIFCNENTRASRYVAENYLPSHKPYNMYDDKK